MSDLTRENVDVHNLTLKQLMTANPVTLSDKVLEEIQPKFAASRDSNKIDYETREIDCINGSLLHGNFHPDAANKAVYDGGYFESKGEDGSPKRQDLAKLDDYRAKLQQITDDHLFLLKETTVGNRGGYSMTADQLANGEVASLYETFTDGNITYHANLYPDQDEKLMSANVTIQNQDGSKGYFKWDDQIVLKETKMSMSDGTALTSEFAHDDKFLWLTSQTTEEAGSKQLKEFHRDGTMAHEHDNWADSSETDIKYDEQGHPTLEQQRDIYGHLKPPIDYTKPESPQP